MHTRHSFLCFFLLFESKSRWFECLGSQRSNHVSSAIALPVVPPIQPTPIHHTCLFSAALQTVGLSTLSSSSLKLQQSITLFGG